MLLFETYAKTWPMCLASLAVFWGVAALAWWFRAPRLERALPAKAVLWAALIPGFVLLAVCLTLVDKPHFDLSAETKDWLFMFSAFLGIPVAVPLLMCAVWALAHHVRGETVKRSGLVLVALIGLGLGGAASNIHDVVWCGVITDGFTQHFKAGYDLDVFVAFGNLFGIADEVLQDYATLGPYTVLLVIGELTVAVAALVRLLRIPRTPGQPEKQHR